MSKLNQKVRIRYDSYDWGHTTLGMLKDKWIQQGEDPKWVGGVLKLMQDRGHVTIRGILYELK